MFYDINFDLIEHKKQDEKIKKFIESLKKLELIDDKQLPKNFNLNNINSGHILTLLTKNRYYQENAGFLVIYDKDILLSCAGFHPFILDGKKGTIIFSRFFINKKYRGNRISIVDNYFAPFYEERKKKFGNFLWMTMNEDRKLLYNTFEKQSNNFAASVGMKWPLYLKKFVPIGLYEIFHTPQYVVEQKI